MIEIPAAALVAVGVAICLVAVLVGAVLMRLSQAKQNNQIEEEKGWLPMPPLIHDSATEFYKAAIQPQNQKNGILTSLGIVKPKFKVYSDPEVNSEALGRLNFGISYDKEHQTLCVHVIQAVSLAPMDLCGSSDPYVRAFLIPQHVGGDVKVTRVQRRNLNPNFNQTLHFQGHSMKKLEEMSLCMQVMDYDRFTRDDPIGEILLPMKNVKFENCPVYWKQLQKSVVQKEGKGEVMLSLCYMPQTQKMTVVVIKGKDFPAKDISGSSDPYVKLWLIDQGNKSEKKKTTVKTQTLNPIYNESFTFTIQNDEHIKNMALVATVMDYDLLSSNDEMGHVLLGEKGSETGKKHWAEMLVKPGYPVAMWHRLAPKW